MNATHDFMIRISPESGRVRVEHDVDGVITHKEVSRNTLIKCFCTGIRADTPGRGTGMLPLNTLAVWQSESELRIVLWYPKLRANVALYDTPYPNFPLPRLVFGATFDEGGKLTGSRLGVVADEVPTPDTVMYYYPFSNVFEGSDGICMGANSAPTYKKLWKAVNLPAYLLSIPNNMHMFNRTHNQKGMQYRELMEHLKDKEPSYYYTDILIPNGKTLGDFIDNM